MIENANLNRAAAIHYTSEYELRLAQELRLAPPSAVIPCGVNAADFENLPLPGSFRRRYPGLGNKRLVVFLGRLAPQKGLDLLIEAFDRVLKTAKDVHLVIAGPDQEGYLRSVTAWLENRGLLEHTTITGGLYGRDKLELLADTDVWVLPSYAENFGIAVIEALACRLAVVVSDRVGIQAQISGAHAGIVVPCQPNALAQGILSILQDSSLRHQLGEAGSRLAKGFTWEAAAAEMLQLYERILCPVT